METSTTYDRPREKLQKRGVASLTNLELLQILIGSGNTQASVQKIARRTLKLLSRHGNEITLQQMTTVTGLGIARASLILASFELASRYPVSRKQKVIDTKDKQDILFAEVRTSSKQLLTYVTLDGGNNFIAQRTAVLDPDVLQVGLLRDLFLHVVNDQAARIIVATGMRSHTLQPSLYELGLAKDLTSMAQLFNVSVQSFVLLNTESELHLKGQAW